MGTTKHIMRWLRIDSRRKLMRDYIKRFLIALIMGLFVSLLFLGGKQFETGNPTWNHHYLKTDLSDGKPITSQINYF
jgi:hypothetical protein